MEHLGLTVTTASFTAAQSNATIHMASESVVIIFITCMITQGIVGIIGNALILAYYPAASKQGHHSGQLIRRLAFVDLLACLFMPPYVVVYELKINNNIFICKISELIRYYIVTASLFTLVGVAVERYYLVKRPNKPLTERHMKSWLVFSVVGSFAVAVPAVFKYNIVELEYENMIHMAPPKPACYQKESNYSLIFVRWL